MINNSTPLAARMRPRSAEELIGQEKQLANGSPLNRLLHSGKNVQSVILWGPPGIGKTSIAHVIAGHRRLVQLSAITAGVKEVREVIEQAKKDAELFETSTCLFLDEIHRFSKSQQDSLLPAVEAGWIVLIAATTENPSFSVIAPLISRSITVALEPLSDSDINQVLDRALKESRGLAGEVVLPKHVRDQIVRLASGDARRALTTLEATALAAFERDQTLPVETTIQDLETSLAGNRPRYDRAGDMHYDVISAFIKSVRGSDADAACHYLARMIDAGEDPRFIARRLVILASEDIGLADPTALQLAVAAADAVALVGMPEGRIPLAQATIYLSTAPKSNSAYKAINAALADVRDGLTPAIPQHLRSATGVGYIYPHDDPRGITQQQYAPKEATSKRYYLATEFGAEKDRAALWKWLRMIIRGEK